MSAVPAQITTRVHAIREPIAAQPRCNEGQAEQQGHRSGSSEQPSSQPLHVAHCTAVAAERAAFDNRIITAVKRTAVRRLGPRGYTLRMSKASLGRIVLFCLFIFAAVVFLTGIQWGLPSRSADRYLFGSEPVSRGMPRSRRSSLSRSNIRLNASSDGASR